MLLMRVWTPMVWVVELTLSISASDSMMTRSSAASRDARGGKARDRDLTCALERAHGERDRVGGRRAGEAPQRARARQPALLHNCYGARDTPDNKLVGPVDESGDVAPRRDEQWPVGRVRRIHRGGKRRVVVGGAIARRAIGGSVERAEDWRQRGWADSGGGRGRAALDDQHHADGVGVRRAVAMRDLKAERAKQRNIAVFALLRRHRRGPG